MAIIKNIKRQKSGEEFGRWSFRPLLTVISDIPMVPERDTLLQKGA